ncbi:hypothetical protein L345_03142, partial [Ophiophagus hannah]
MNSGAAAETLPPGWMVIPAGSVLLKEAVRSKTPCEEDLLSCSWDSSPPSLPSPPFVPPTPHGNWGCSRGREASLSKAIRNFPGQQPGIPPSPLPVLPNARQSRPRSTNGGSSAARLQLKQHWGSPLEESSAQSCHHCLLLAPLMLAAAAAGLAVPSLFLPAFGVLPLSPHTIFPLEPSSATLWLRGLFLPPSAAGFCLVQASLTRHTVVCAADETDGKMEKHPRMKVQSVQGLGLLLPSSSSFGGPGGKHSLLLGKQSTGQAGTFYADPR